MRRSTRTQTTLQWLLLSMSLAGTTPVWARAPAGGAARVVRGDYALVRLAIDASLAGDGSERRDATVVVRGGKVVCVGACEVAAGVETIDCAGLRAYPGLVETASELGQVEVNAEVESQDGSPGLIDNAAHVRAADGLALDSRVIEAARWGGVLFAVSRPRGDALIAGTGVAFLLAPPRREAILVAEASVHAQIGERPRKADRPLMAGRSGQVALLRALLAEARRIGIDSPGAAIAAGLERSTDRAALLALVPVLRGERPLVVEAHRAADIEAAMAVAAEFRVKLVILGGAEAWTLAAQLAAVGVTVLLSPAQARPYAFETARARDDAAVLLHKAGVRVGIAYGRAHGARNLRWDAGALVAQGLTPAQALGACTTVPAAAFGFAAALSLRVGAPPAVVLYRGDPLTLQGRVAAVVLGATVEWAPAQR